MVITLYKNFSDDKTTDKILREPINKTVTRKDTWSIENPTFTVTLEENDYILLGYNYCYIDAFQRYYYCRISLANGGLAVISCNVDALMSHKNGIRALNCMVERQENVFNPYATDNLISISQGTIIDTIKGSQV